MFKVNNKDTSLTPCSNVFVINFKQVNAGWDTSISQLSFGFLSFVVFPRWIDQPNGNW